jgi:predicted acyl esterase
MRRFRLHSLTVATLAAVLCFPAFPASPAQAATTTTPEDWQHSGTLAVGHATTGFVGGVTEAVGAADCLAGTDTAVPAVDSERFALPDGAEGHAARLEYTSASGDADLYAVFWDTDNATGCLLALGQAGSMQEAGRDEPELGYVPEGADAVSVDALSGTDVHYSFTVELSQPRVYPAPDAPAEEHVRDFAVTRPDPDGETVLNPDGVTVLKGHVHVPTSGDEYRGPVVLDMNPYWNWSSDASGSFEDSVTGDLLSPDDSATSLKREYRQFLAAGFAVALVNNRGSGLSEGCTQFGSPTEIDDVGAVIQKLADEYGGPVGMYGISYAGWSAFMGVASHAPALRAIVPVDGVIDPWNTVTIRGAPTVPQFGHYWRASNTAAAAIGDYQPDLSRTPYRPGCEDDTERWPPIWRGDRGRYWGGTVEEEGVVGGVDLRPLIEGTDVAVFAANGMRPPGGNNVVAGTGHILQFEGLWDLLGGKKRLLLGQWGHQFPTTHRPNFPSAAIAWFDEHLRDGRRLLASGVVEYQDDRLAWHTTRQWPPPGGQHELLLSDGGLVSDPREVLSGSKTFTGVGAPCLRQCPDVESTGQVTSLSVWPDEHVDTCIANHVAYMSAPLTRDLRMAGNFELDLHLASTEPDGDLFAYLIESETGDCPDADARILARAVIDLRHIPTQERGVEAAGRGGDFPTSDLQDVSLVSLPFAATARAGTRLVLAIGGDGRELNLVPETAEATITIATGNGAPGAIRLPIAQPAA